MQTKNLLWITAALLLFTACGKKYTVTAECDASSNGKQAYIIDYTTEKPLDSTIVSGNKAIFEGKTPEAKLCQFFVNSPSRESATFSKAEISSSTPKPKRYREPRKTTLCKVSIRP